MYQEKAHLSTDFSFKKDSRRSCLNELGCMSHPFAYPIRAWGLRWAQKVGALRACRVCDRCQHATTAPWRSPVFLLTCRKVLLSERMDQERKKKKMPHFCWFCSPIGSSLGHRMPLA
ncbi:hypothetical protein CDAR_7871 [Caerostris darwini]|uniref:Uncharacterized protein n=1 Tax=Caerostris darwini TaxID=1538125 RepID=A0AAV4QAK7_9ARAC|nr:hypothetical protein CDAR_7871 [Caerostris darwini]